MSFEDRLLQELRSMVAADPAAAGERRRPARWASPRRFALAGVAVALVGAAAVAGVQLVSGGAAPAYAVNRNDDGTVTVEISSLSDSAGLERKLRDAGVPALVQYLPPGKACRQPWPTAAPGGPSAPGGKQAVRGGVEHTPDGTTRFTISRNLPPDVTLVIMTQVGPGDADPSGGRAASAIAIILARGDVQPCEIVDAPAGAPPLRPAPAGAQVHTGNTPAQGTDSSGG